LPNDAGKDMNSSNRDSNVAILYEQLGNWQSFLFLIYYFKTFLLNLICNVLNLTETSISDQRWLCIMWSH
jgi:hypothetical protein